MGTKPWKGGKSCTMCAHQSGNGQLLTVPSTFSRTWRLQCNILNICSHTEYTGHTKFPTNHSPYQTIYLTVDFRSLFQFKCLTFPAPSSAHWAASNSINRFRKATDTREPPTGKHTSNTAKATLTRATFTIQTLNFELAPIFLMTSLFLENSSSRRTTLFRMVSSS